VGFCRVLFGGVPSVFVLDGVLVVFLRVSNYMVSKPVSSILEGNVSVGRSYLGWWSVCRLAFGVLRFVLSWVAVCCVLSSVCWCGS